MVPDVERYLTTDSSPDFLGLDGRGEAWGRGIDGRGVVVGVIDSGIWPEHPSFADDGSYTYPAGVNPDIPCEFGNTDFNPADVAFECNNKLLGARQVMATYEAVVGIEDVEFDSARDHHGHGSHTASTAAGNRGVPAEVLGRDLGTVSGIAPRAHIIAYKTAGGDFGLSFSSDLAVAIDAAVGDGVDVINYSIGSGNLTGVESIAFLFATDAGVLDCRFGRQRRQRAWRRRRNDAVAHHGGGEHPAPVLPRSDRPRQRGDLPWRLAHPGGWQFPTCRLR